MGTHLTFSTRMTELDWSHGGDLLACTLYMPRGRTLSGSCTARRWGVWELFWACRQLENKEERMTKGLQWIYSHCWRMHMWCCLAVLRPQTSVCPRKSQSFCLHFFCPFVRLPHLPTLSLPLLFHCCQWILPPASPSVSFFSPFPSSPSLPPSHFPSLHVPLSIVVICPVANSASVCLSRLCW